MKWFSNNRKEQRRNNNNCYKCSNPRHFAAECRSTMRHKSRRKHKSSEHQRKHNKHFDDKKTSGMWQTMTNFILFVLP